MTPNYPCWISTRIFRISWSARIPSDPTESHLKRTFGSFNFAQGFLLKTTSPKTHTKTSSKRYPEIKTQHCHYTPHQKITKYRWSRDNERYLSHSFYYLPQARPPVIRYGTLHWHVAPRVWQLQQRISSRSAATALIASWTWNPKERMAHLKKRKLETIK